MFRQKYCKSFLCALFLAAGLASAAQAQTTQSIPYSGTPAAIPGTIQAEDFDLGGEGIAYHDTTASNAGGQYRPSEDVDIFVSNDPAGGGYIIKNFEPSEWLGYTIDVPASGNYDIEIRASTHIDFPNAAYHVEIDGVNVTGTVVLPTTNTVGWSNYQWIGKKTVQLAAGTRVLKLVSDQPYFAFNAIRVTAGPPPAPYSGTPILVPATWEAENFDLGGQDVAYRDSSAGNAGGQHRTTEDVDIFASNDPAGGGYIIKNFEAGEWLGYTISVPTSGNYDIEIRAVTNSTFPNSAYHVEIDGVNVTGSVVLPTTDTAGWSNFQWIGKKTVQLAAGTRVLKFVSDQPYFALNAIRVTATPLPTPYSGTPIAVPATFEAENFDLGGESVAYHDRTSGNAGGQYRLKEDVDIIVSADSAGGGYVVNNFETGEWLAYTINVPATAQYDIEIRASTTFANSAYHIEIDGKDVTGTIAVPGTGSWSAFQWLGKKRVPLAAGKQALKIVADQQYFNLNSLRVGATDTQAPSIPANLAATVVSSSQIDLAWSAATDNVGVSGYFVYRNGVQVASVSRTGYSDTGLSAATPYSYASAAYDAAGNVSAQSSVVSATTGALQLPYSGTPFAVPGIIQAQDFNLGGQGVAYHDTTAGNAGGQYRTSEDVDIFVSNDAWGGGYIIKNFEAGEWLGYTISVPASGNYDIEIRAVTNSIFPNSAYHVEVDGVNVTGSVVLPTTDTVGWSNFQWIGKKTVQLAAGTHVLKVVADQPYFALNAIRVTDPSSAVVSPSPSTSSAKLLFSSGFEGLTALNPPTAGWQEILGLDDTTGFLWPGSVWGGGMKFQTITGLPIDDATTEDYMVNRIETVTGHDGNPTRALYMEIKKKGGTYMQDAFLLLPASEQGDMYISFWVKFQPDLLQKMTPQNWRALFEWKTAGDYRMVTYVASWEDGCGGVKSNGALFWRVQGDNEANGGLPYQQFWRVDNCSKVVPVGEWFKIEGFWHRSSGADGRIWIAVNGQVIADRYGPNMGVNNKPINRIFLPVLYSQTPYPIYQWVDNLQIWDGFPADAAPH